MREFRSTSARALMLLILSIVVCACDFSGELRAARSRADAAEAETARLKKELAEVKEQLASLQAAKESTLGKIYGVPENTLMRTVAKWAVLLLVCAGLLALCLLMIGGIISADHALESLLRAVALMIGLLAYFGARTIGVSIPQLLFATLKDSGPLVFGLISLATAVPAGALLAWYVERIMAKGSDRAYRIAILLGVLITTLLTDLLAQAFTAGLSITTLAPDISFVIGLGLYIIFKLDTRRLLAA